MKLTPEQESQIAHERAQDPSKARFRITATSDQRAEFIRGIEEEEAGKVENIARCRRLEELLKEESLTGDLRRGIEDDERDYPALAASAGLDAELLREFFWGDGELSMEEIDRLAKALHLRLTPVEAT